MTDVFLQRALEESGLPLTFAQGKFEYQWEGRLTESEQIRALAQASGFHAQHCAPVIYVQSDRVFGHWYFPAAGEMTEGQARAAVDTLGRGIPAFLRGLGEHAVDRGMEWEADAPEVTYGRVADWFAQRGVSELPQDEETGALCLAMDGTPVDIQVGETFSVQVSAVVPDGDPASVLHYCNHLNSSGRPAICGVRDGEQWWAISRYSVEARAGLSDAQLDQAIREGVTGAGAQVRDLLRLHQG